MNKTEKYQLNQWEMTDRIMMEDFNQDNKAIEEALTAHDEALTEQADNLTAQITTVRAENHFVLLKEFHFEEDSLSYSFPLDDEARSFHKLYIMGLTKVGSGSVFYCGVNSDTAEENRCKLGSNASGYSDFTITLTAIGPNRELHLSGSSYNQLSNGDNSGTSGSVRFSAVTLDDVQTVDMFLPSDTTMFRGGVTARMYGFR